MLTPINASLSFLLPCATVMCVPLQENIEKFIERPVAADDVPISSIFTEEMFQQLVVKMQGVEAFAPGIEFIKEQWTNSFKVRTYARSAPSSGGNSCRMYRQHVYHVLVWWVVEWRWRWRGGCDHRTATCSAMVVCRGVPWWAVVHTAVVCTASPSAHPRGYAWHS